MKVSDRDRNVKVKNVGCVEVIVFLRAVYVKIIASCKGGTFFRHSVDIRSSHGDDLKIKKNQTFIITLVKILLNLGSQELLLTCCKFMFMASPRHHARTLLGLISKLARSTLCVSKSSHFSIVCNFIESLRFSKFLHCWKAYEICYKTYTLLTSP